MTFQTSDFNLCIPKLKLSNLIIHNLKLEMKLVMIK